MIDINNIIYEMEGNEFIPCQFINYTKHIVENTIDGKYYQALLDTPSAVIRDIGILFRKAGDIVGLSPEELLRQSSFKKKDFNPNKIPSFFAELRAIVYLKIENFTNIKILKEGKTKRADFLAEKNGCKYSVEVTNAGYEGRRGYWGHDDIVELLLKKLISNEKYKQLEETSIAEGCDRKALILVIDTPDKVALNSPHEYQNMLKDAWERFDENEKLHLSIVTGRETLGYGRDDVVYPAW